MKKTIFVFILIFILNWCSSYDWNNKGIFSQSGKIIKNEFSLDLDSIEKDYNKKDNWVEISTDKEVYKPWEEVVFKINELKDKIYFYEESWYRFVTVLNWMNNREIDIERKDTYKFSLSKKHWGYVSFYLRFLVLENDKLVVKESNTATILVEKPDESIAKLKSVLFGPVLKWHNKPLYMMVWQKERITPYGLYTDWLIRPLPKELWTNFYEQCYVSEKCIWPNYMEDKEYPSEIIDITDGWYVVAKRGWEANILLINWDKKSSRLVHIFDPEGDKRKKEEERKKYNLENPIQAKMSYINGKNSFEEFEERLDKFLEEWWDINIKDENGQTLLSRAINTYNDNKTKRIKTILEKWADPNMEFWTWVIKTHILKKSAINYKPKKVEEVKLLIEYWVDISRWDFFSGVYNIELAEFLVEYGADICRKNWSWESIEDTLSYYVENKHIWYWCSRWDLCKSLIDLYKRECS